MEIRRLFTNTNEAPLPERFLAIQIQEGVVKSAIWQVVNNQPEVVALGSTEIWTDGPSLVMSTDASLSTAFSQAGSEPDRVVFGLPESWIVTDKIAPAHAPTIKALLEQLELKPLGFVGTTEAIIQYLRVREGIPPSVILVELGQTKLGVVVTRVGEIVGRQEVGRSSDVGADVEEALARMNVDQLPSRILVTDSRDLEVIQQLTSYPWQEKLPFLHLPKVEALDPSFSVMAVAVSGGSEAARSVGIQTESPDDATKPDIKPVETAALLSSKSDFGFVADADIQKVDQLPIEDEVTPAKIASRPLKLSLPKISLARPKLKVNFHLPKFQGRSRLLVVLIPLVLLFLAGLGVVGAGLFLTKADVTVTLTSRSIDKTVTAAVGGASGDLPILNATTDTQELQETKTLATTGETVVGDKAAGEVTIFNKTDTVRTLPRGTVLSTGTGLHFVLDTTVSVASRSAQETAGGVNIVYGQNKVNVTASKIGANYNLPANTSLSVADFPKSTLEAKVGSELTGGSSRTVKAVAQADRDNLTSQLTQMIHDEAQNRFGNTGSDKTIVMQDVKITSQSFNKGVGEEADELTLTLKGQVTLLHISPSDLQNFIQTQVQTQIPAGFDLDMTNSTIDLTSPQTINGKLTTSVPIHARLTPQISLDRFRDQLVGKSLFDARTLLQNIPGYQKARIMITPTLPLVDKRMPLNVKNITLRIDYT